MTKSDLFVTLHVPYDLLDPILAALSRDTRIDLPKLSEEEMRQLERDSCQLVTAALDRRADGVERRGFTLADVAVLSPPTRSLVETQRLFGYLRAVLEADLRPENIQLTPDVEELARRALLLPPAQRTLFEIARTMHVGVFKARLIKTVEAAGATVHAPLPTLDLGAYTPEFRAPRRRRHGPAARTSGRPPRAPGEAEAPSRSSSRPGPLPKPRPDPPMPPPGASVAGAWRRSSTPAGRRSAPTASSSSGPARSATWRSISRRLHLPRPRPGRSPRGRTPTAAGGCRTAVAPPRAGRSRRRSATWPRSVRPP